MQPQGKRLTNAFHRSADSQAGRVGPADGGTRKGASWPPEPRGGRGGGLTQTLNHRIQRSHGRSINPRVLGVEVVCNGNDDREQHGEQALSEERNHLGKGLECPLVHFLVGILKPWGESIKDLWREQKPRAHGSPSWAGVPQPNQAPSAGTPPASLAGVA